MRKIDVSALLDTAVFNSFHARVMLWCALIIIFDGYDLIIYGVVLPTLMETWSLTALQAGILGSFALVGMMLGALFFHYQTVSVAEKPLCSVSYCLAA